MARYFALFAVVALAATMLFGCGEEEVDENILRVGTEASFAPFEYVDENGDITGFDPDLIAALAEKMGYDGVDVSHIDWDGLDSALNSDLVDAVIAGVTITPERQLEMDFSDPYFKSTLVIVVPEESSVQGLEDIMEMTIGVQANTTGHIACENAGIPDEQIAKFPTNPDAMMSLSSGSVEAVVADSPVVMNYLAYNEGLGLKIIEEDGFAADYFGIKVKKGNTELVDALNVALAEAQEDGTYDEIFGKYFQK